MIEEINNENPQETVEKVPVIGEFSLPGVIGFASVNGSIRINAEDAFIEGRQLSGMFDHLVFKLTVRDNETVDFEEMDTNETTSEERKRLLEKFIDSEPIVGKLGGMYNPSDFTFISTVESKLTQKQIPLVLLTKYKTSTDKLGDIAAEEVVVADDNQRQAVSDFLKSLELEEDEKGVPIAEKEEVAEEEIPMVDDQVNNLKVSKEEMIEAGIIHRDELGQAMLESNEYVKKELLSRIQRKENELTENAKRKEKITDELTDLQNRVKAIDKKAVSNGMLFCVSEEMTTDKPEFIFDQATIDAIQSKVRKLGSINTEAFMNIFKVGKYIITIGDENGDMLKEDAKIELPKDVRYEDGKFIYIGEKQWHDVVEEMLDLGYGQDADFDKKSGSNSYVFVETLNPDLPNPSSLAGEKKPLTFQEKVEKFFNDIIAKIKSWF